MKQEGEILIGVVIAGIIAFWLECVYLKRKKEQFVTYVKVLSLLFVAIIYTGWVLTLQEDEITSPHLFLEQIFVPIQNFLTLKGWRE